MSSKLKYIFLTVFLLMLFSSQESFANFRDTNSIVRIYNSILRNDKVIEFDLQIRRIVPYWDRWANGTFQLTFDDPSFTFDSDVIDIQRVGDIGLRWVNSYEETTRGYLSKLEVFENRICISVIGPDTYEFATDVPTNAYMTLGRFRVLIKPGAQNQEKSFFNPTTNEVISLIWKEPYDYFQALAYKTATKVDLEGITDFYISDDNIELHDPTGSTVASYRRDITPRPDFTLVSFTARYVGERRILLDWETASESMNRGFILHRVPTPAYASVIDQQVDYSKAELVRRYDDGNVLAPQLIGLGNSSEGRIYQYAFDTAEYRGINYCYKLSYQDIQGIVWDVGTTCVGIPNAVITYAQNNPNPFHTTTQVEYTVADNVHLKADLYDVGGNRLRTLIDNPNHPPGTYAFDVNIPEYASSGLYEIIFISTPIDDKSIEISTAVVKLQVIR